MHVCVCVCRIRGLVIYSFMMLSAWGIVFSHAEHRRRARAKEKEREKELDRTELSCTKYWGFDWIVFMATEDTAASQILNMQSLSLFAAADGLPLCVYLSIH